MKIKKILILSLSISVLINVVLICANNIRKEETIKIIHERNILIEEVHILESELENSYRVCKNNN